MRCGEGRGLVIMMMKLEERAIALFLDEGDA